MGVAAELRTLKRPSGRGGVAPPTPGEPAPALPGVDVGDGRPRVVAFVRHVGCPFAEATLRGLRETATAEPDVDCVAVTHSEQDVSADWAERSGG